MEEKKIVRYKLIKHRWPDEIKAAKNKKLKRIGIVVACAVFFAGGFFCSNLFAGREVTQDPTFAKFSEVYSIMKDQFYFAKDQKNFSDKLMSGAIAGMVNAGEDMHTAYLDAKTSQSFTSSMEGHFVGIGVQYYGLDDSNFVIDKVFKNSPAQEAGMMKGDRIYAINDKVCKGSTDEVAAMIKGEPNTKVKIEIIREGKHKVLQVMRREVNDSVFSEIEGKTGILELSSFSETSGDEFGKHLKDMKKQKCDNLILDLRDNGGGYLVAAQKIASYLLPANTTIFKEQSKDGSTKDYKTLDDYEQYKFKNIVVLVNGDTASASEVLTAALKEHLNVQVVGVNTYGKGTVQIPLTFKDGSMIKYTTAEWLTPKGNKLNGVGIKPDVVVKLDPAITTGTPKIDDNEVYKADTVNIVAKSVQLQLQFLGYRVDRIDEYFSPASAQALKQYQKDKGIKVTGEINADVISSILSSSAIKWHNEKQELDLQMKKAKAMVNGK